MAKLGSYFALCPIIDQKSLLGINEDCEAENVLVTLGKNIAIKYKVSDQKQVTSWRTKDKFSSPVIYYKEEESYCAAFNQSYIRTWKDEENIDKLKKYKFPTQIHTLINYAGTSFVIFKNGHVAKLKDALDQRKDLNPNDVIHSDDNILDVLQICNESTVYIGLLIESAGNIYFTWTIFQGDQQSEFRKINVNQPNLSLQGFILMLNGDNEVVLLTIWSDGKFFIYSLEKENECNFFAKMEFLSSKERITLFALNQDYVAMYGDNSNQEGASLIIFNVQFKVIQSHVTFKMFTSGTRLWCLHGNLYLSVGQNLAVVPYHLDTEQLAALVGSHKVSVEDPDVTIVQICTFGEWDKTQKNDLQKAVKKEFQEYVQQGWSESAICSEVLPKYIEKQDVDSITEMLGVFKDIPECFISKLLDFALNADGGIFSSNTKADSGKIPPQLAPFGRCLFIDRILMLKYSDVLLLPHLRSNLDLETALLLLRYMSYLLSEDGHTIFEDITLSERKLIEWGTLVLDANYQRLLLTREDKIIEILIYFNNLVKAHLCCIEDLNQIYPVAVELQKGNSFNKCSSANLKYCIEELKLC